MQHRIIIFGGVCSGKSYLARCIARQLSIPCIHLDDVFWYGNWEHLTKDEFQHTVDLLTSPHSCWIIEGNYSSFLENNWKTATHIVYCYHNILVLILRAFKRSLDHSRSGIPEKVKPFFLKREPLLGLIKHILRHSTQKKEHDFALIEQIYINGGNVSTLKTSHRNVNRFIKSLLIDNSELQ